MIENEKIFMLGCFDMGKLVGAVAIMDFCHVSLLFVDKKYQCKGIAKSTFCKSAGVMHSKKSRTMRNDS